MSLPQGCDSVSALAGFADRAQHQLFEGGGDFHAVIAQDLFVVDLDNLAVFVFLSRAYVEADGIIIDVRACINRRASSTSPAGFGQQISQIVLDHRVFRIELQASTILCRWMSRVHLVWRIPIPDYP